MIYNNNSWGMWPQAVGSARSMHMYLFQENLRYDKMAEGLGARGEYVRRRSNSRRAERSLRRGGEGAAFHADQLPGAEGIHVGEGLSARNFMNPEPGGGAFQH